MLQMGADVNMADHNGVIPLMCAVSDQHTPMGIIELLVRSGSRLTMHCLAGPTAGFTAAHLAMLYHKKALDYLLVLGMSPFMMTREVVPRTLRQLARDHELVDLYNRFGYLELVYSETINGNVRFIFEEILQHPCCVPPMLYLSRLPTTKLQELQTLVAGVNEKSKLMFSAFFDGTADDETSDQSEVFGPVAEELAECVVPTNAKSRKELKFVEGFIQARLLELAVASPMVKEESGAKRQKP
jgi:hypothetical protein